MSTYSQQLIIRTQQYFSKKHGLVLTAEQTTDYLDSLADLYEVMGKAAAARLKAAEPPDLINTHNCNL